MLRPIRNEEDYETALDEIAALWKATPGTPTDTSLGSKQRPPVSA